MTEALAKWIWDGAAGVLGLLFPHRCAGCDRIDQPSICPACSARLRPIDPAAGCRLCGEVLGGYEGAFPGLCHKCRKQRPRYKQAVAAYRYADPLSRVIPLWKYESQRHLSEALSGLLIDWVASSAPEWWEKVDIVVPVPHHPRTVRVRGFSPPEDLAAAICESYSLQYVPRALFKTRLTRPQMGLNFESRVANLRGSMRVFDPPLVLDRTVLLVDDVMTTGATLDECARALMDAGAFQVYGIVLARQSTVLQRDTCPSLDINLLQVL